MAKTGKESAVVDHFLWLAFGDTTRRKFVAWLREMAHASVAGAPKLTISGPSGVGKTWLKTLIQEQWPKAEVRTSNIEPGTVPGTVRMGYADVELPDRQEALEHLIWLSRT